MRTEQQIREIANKYDVSDRVLFVTEGSDYDYEADMMTKEIAEAENIMFPSEEDDYGDISEEFPEFAILSEVVNEMMSAIIAEWERE